MGQYNSADDDFDDDMEDNESDDYYESDDDMDFEEELPVVEKRSASAIVGDIEWDPSLSVDIAEIDEHQKKIFGILNNLINHQDQDEEGSRDPAGMVAELTEFSRFYFSKEEEYLRRCGYPDIDCHSKEHRQFIKNTINLRRQVAEDKKNLSFDTVSFLRDWLVNHISGSDRAYVPFVRINSYVEESRLRR